MRQSQLIGIIVFSLLICFPIITLAQVVGQGSSQLGLAKGRALGSYQISDIENINYFTGRVNVTIPLTNVQGRGDVNIPVNASISSPGWKTYVEPVADNNGNGGYSPGLFAEYGYSSVNRTLEIRSRMKLDYVDYTTCYGGPFYQGTLTRIYVTFPDGTEYELRDTLTDGQVMSMSISSGCFVYPNRGKTFVSKDGSNLKFVADADIRDDGVTDFPSGVLYLPNGQKINANGFHDRNGNITTLNSVIENGEFFYNSTDSIGRITTIQPSYNTNYGLANSYVKYKGYSGQDRQYSVVGSAMSDALASGETIKTYLQLFPNLPNYGTGNYGFDPYVISEIILPNGQSYRFKYNSYGDLARIEFPTGAVVEYTWANGVNGAESSGQMFPGSFHDSFIYRRVIERRLYSDGVNLTNTLTISRPESLNGYNTPFNVGYVDVKTYAPHLLGSERHYYYGQATSSFSTPINNFNYSNWKTGREYQTDVFSPQDSSLLRRTTQSWQQTSPSWWTCQYCNGDNAPVNNPKIVETTVLLADSNQVSKKTFSYDTQNNLTDTYEYDYGNGTSGAFLRRSHTDYLTTNPVNNINYTDGGIYILNLPTQTWVSSDINGNTKVSLTKFEYDNYATDQNHAGLLNRSTVTGHDSNYGTSYTTRGNVTKVTSYADANNQTGAVHVYTQYDILGNPVKTIDARGNATTVDYSDRFGTPDGEARNNSAPSLLNGQQTFAFATSATNAIGYTTYAQFDYYTSAGVDAEDIIGNVSTIFYNDVLDRPTQVITANNRPQFRKQESVVYDDVNRKVTITSDSKVYGDNLIKTESFYDKMGRTFETRQYETISDYIVTLQEFDDLGRAYKSSNPFRPYLNEQPQWTITGFDFLGRVIQVQTPDNAVVTRSYSGRTTTVTDQSLRKRSGTTDALGRLLKVVEDPNGLNYETTYIYDVLGRLRKTTQTEGQTTQNRYFMYNDLGHLIRAKQPEQNANANLSITDPVTGNGNWSVSYSYDNNGNITSTIDANNRTVTGIYDNLNRLTLRDYSDTSMPVVTFTYDDPNIANSKGQMTAVSSTVSQTYYTAFDELGRVKSSQQVTGGQTYNFPDYSYDFSGALVAQTYHSGRVVSIETDNIGRLSKVKGQVPNHAERTYLSHISYTSFGAIEKLRLGNGVWESAQFDPKRLQVKQIGLGASSGDISYLKLEYDYGTTDNNGSLKQQKITVPGMASQLIQNYSYDMLNRLLSATETKNGSQSIEWRQTFLYDRFGNRRFNANETTTLPANNGVYNPQIDPTTNRFTVAEGYNYDNEGNLTGNPENQLFSYDIENRLKQVENTAMQTTANYFYDGNGKRVRKVVGNQETIFVYDAFGKLVAEYTMNQPLTADGTKYMTTDALGSPRAISDISGHVVSRHDYMPFGEEVASGIGGRSSTQGYLINGDGIRQQFTGYERDTESGLDYAQARYFSSKHGRFTSVDPLTASAEIKNPQTFNRYSYGLNSPYKFVDPLGLRPCSGASWEVGSCNNNGDLSGGGVDRSLADYHQRLQNTLDTAAVNRAVANNDQATAKAICAGNANIQCEDDDKDNAPTITLDEIDLVNTSNASDSDVLAEGEVNAPLTGPTVVADELKQRLKEGAKVFLRVKFSISGGAGRGSFRTTDDEDASDSFSVSTGTNSKWKIAGKIVVDAGDKTATVYVPISIQDGISEKISIKATVNWIDKVETGVPGSLKSNVSKNKTFTFNTRVRFKFSE